MIIERADKLGLAQLHQLRGRVGRSHHQAYAYLVPSIKGLKGDAEKRLDAIQRASTLGAGFMLATEDWRFVVQVSYSVSNKVVQCKRLVIVCIWKCWKKRPKPFKRSKHQTLMHR
jgi:hypothetical protein